MTDRPEALELAPGTPVLGRCVIDRLVRRGPLATVYIARAKGTAGEWYTVRVVHPEKLIWSERAAEVFHKEMDRVRGLFHPAIPRLVAFDTAAPAPVLLTANASGPTLRELIASGAKPSLQEVAHTISEVAAALASLHVATPPIFHRGVCPEEIIAARHGTGIWLEGCGLAHALAVSGMIADRPTVMAEPGYLVPEELFPPSARSDIFALATVAFEYLTGQRPFDRAGPAALSLAVHGAAFPRPESLRTHLPGDAQAVFARAWTLSPDSGYLSPIAFARDLADALGIRSERDRHSSEPARVAAADDLDRAFDAMLQQAPSPPTPSIADLARLVAPPTPAPPPPSAAPPSALSPDESPAAAASPDPTEGLPAGEAPPAAAQDKPAAPPGRTLAMGNRAQIPRPMSATRGNTPPPLPPRWPTLRAAGGLFRPAAPRPSNRTLLGGSAPAAGGGGEKGEVPDAPGTLELPAHLSMAADEPTPIVGYERVSATTEPGAASRSGSSAEIRIDELVPVEGSALTRAAGLRTGDNIPDPGRTSEPSIDPGPPLPEDSSPPATDAAPDREEPSPLFEDRPSGDPSFVPSLDDLPQRPKSGAPARTVTASVPELAPLPAPPPPKPVPVSSPAPAPALASAPAPAPGYLTRIPLAILRQAWVIGGFTVVSATILSGALVIAAHELSLRPIEADRTTFDQPDAVVTVIPVEADAAPAMALPDAGLPASDLGQPTDAGADVRAAPDVPAPSDVQIAVIVHDAGPHTVADAGLAVAVDTAGRPTDRQRAIVMAQLRPRVADCVEGIEQAWVNIGVRYEGTAGLAVAVRLHGIFLDPPIGPCLDQAIRGVRIGPFAAPSWDTNLSFPIEPPRWHQTEHRQ